MRKIRVFSLVLCVVLIASVMGNSVCFAEGMEPLFDKVSVFFTVDNIPTLTEGDVSFLLYDENGTEPVSSAVYQLKRGCAGFSVDFQVPEYNIGKKFRFVLSKGAESVTFCESTGSEFVVETYAYLDEAGIRQYQTAFYMELNPSFNKEAVIKVNGTSNKVYAHYFMNDTLYVTTDLLEDLKIDHKIFPALNCFFLSTSSGHTMEFYMNDFYATKGGASYNLPHPVYPIGETPYAPLSEIAVYFACNYVVESDNEYQTVISLTPSVYAAKNEKEEYVNRLNVSSKTDYLIWVDKSDFKVNVFLGKQGDWRYIKSFDCAIGAPSSPTVEGSFEYHAYQPRWTYSSYYCGPIMRFYRGYAIHSTLIRYNGTPYDNRVGMRISHGCVRVRPEGIKWLVDYIPLHTRILVTA